MAQMLVHSGSGGGLAHHPSSPPSQSGGGMLLTVPSWTSGVTFISEGSYVQQLASAFAGTHLESLCELDIDSPPLNHRMSAIICTIGPACRTVEMLEKMIHEGRQQTQIITVLTVEGHFVERIPPLMTKLQI